jgi:hypothetical protein
VPRSVKDTVRSEREAPLTEESDARLHAEVIESKFGVTVIQELPAQQCVTRGVQAVIQELPAQQCVTRGVQVNFFF